MKGDKNSPYHINISYYLDGSVHTIMKYRSNDNPKDARIDIRLRKGDKRKFYKICEDFGLCPSNLVERWIHRFILNSKNVKQAMNVIGNPHDEAMADFDEYMDDTLLSLEEFDRECERANNKITEHFKVSKGK